MSGDSLRHAGARASRDPGSLAIRMRVLEPVSAADGMGGGARSLVHRRSLWAAFEPATPAQRSASPIDNPLALGTVRTALGLAPPPGWHLAWETRGQLRTVEVMACKRGTRSFPFDLCDVREVTSVANTPVGGTG